MTTGLRWPSVRVIDATWVTTDAPVLLRFTVAL